MIFTNELLELQSRIESSIDIFKDNGYLFIRKGVEREIQGITDSTPNYFYIDFQNGESQLEFQRMEGGTQGTHMATGFFKMVIRTSGYTLDSVAENLLAILFDYKCEVQSLSTDEQFIYTSETGEELTTEMDLYMIEFAMSKFVRYKPNCTPINCKEC